MSVREKPTDPASYYDAHVFCRTNRRADGHPRGSCAEKGGEALRDYMKSKAKALGAQERAHQQFRLPRSLRARTERW